MAGPILIVDDDPIQRRLLETAVNRQGHDALVVDGGNAALKTMDGPRGSDLSLVILDLVMPDLDGLAVLGQMRKRGINIPVIVQTAKGSIDTVISAMRAGAFDFVVKPVAPERLQVSIANALKVESLEGEVRRVRRSAAGSLTFKDLITQSPAMDRVIRLGQKAAASNIPILIEGESGVGKELVARAIQGSGERRSKPFVTVNCGAIPDNLVESILFGHEKGSFTGATEKHAGKFVEANKGTLFLDEIGDLPLDVQVKLLRAVQDGEVDPVGARSSVRVDIRLISATHRDLLRRVSEGQFREDLFYRLNVFPIFVPPLRERKDDIPHLVRHFIARFAAEETGGRVSGITADAISLLQGYDWPGNIRQLENAVFRAVVLCEGHQLSAGEFPQIMAQVQGIDPSILAPDHIVPLQVVGDGHHPPLQTPVAHEPGSERTVNGIGSGNGSYGDSASFGIVRALNERGDVRTLADVEEEMIRLAIAHYCGQMSEVARRLGIGRSTLYRKLKEYGIDPDFRRDGRQEALPAE